MREKLQAEWKAALKKILRDYFWGALAFYGPAGIITGTLVVLARFNVERGISFFYILNGVIPGLVSVYVFAQGCRRWEKKPSPFLFFLGTWMGGPLSFIAGVYFGFMPGLFLLTFYYIFLQLVFWLRKKISFRSSMFAFAMSFLIFIIFLYLSFILSAADNQKRIKNRSRGQVLAAKIAERIKIPKRMLVWGKK